MRDGRIDFMARWLDGRQEIEIDLLTDGSGGRGRTDRSFDLIIKNTRICHFILFKSIFLAQPGRNPGIK